MYRALCIDVRGGQLRKIELFWSIHSLRNVRASKFFLHKSICTAKLLRKLVVPWFPPLIDVSSSLFWPCGSLEAISRLVCSHFWNTVFQSLQSTRFPSIFGNEPAGLGFYALFTCSVLFGFGSGNKTLVDLFCLGRTVKHCFGRCEISFASRSHCESRTRVDRVTYFESFQYWSKDCVKFTKF